MRALTWIRRSRERRRAVLVVWPERMTRTTASARVERTTASVTERVGGVSMTMWSYCSRSWETMVRMLAEARSSAGLGGGLPAGRIQRLGSCGELESFVNAGAAHIGVN